jgi:hypothetical protein
MPRRKDIGALLADRKVVETAMRRGVLQAFIKHQQASLPVVVWSNGKTVWLSGKKLAAAIRKLRAELGEKK